MSSESDGTVVYTDDTVYHPIGSVHGDIEPSEMYPWHGEIKLKG